MRTSSAAQLKIDFDAKLLPSASESLIERPLDPPPPLSAITSRIPEFGNYAEAEAYAATSRMAGRINAATVSEQEYKSYLRERQALLDKKLGGTITKKEANRLEYVRWSLDRIEDARYGQTLDALESSVARYEQFLADVQKLDEQLRQFTRRK
jgi:hypothetical protein